MAKSAPMAKHATTAKHAMVNRPAFNTRHHTIETGKHVATRPVNELLPAKRRAETTGPTRRPDCHCRKSRGPRNAKMAKRRIHARVAQTRPCMTCMQIKLQQPTHAQTHAYRLEAHAKKPTAN